MQASPTSLVQEEQHYYVSEQGVNQVLSETVQKIMELNPKLLLGESKLFNYDLNNHSIGLSTSFQNLLTLLVQLDELDSRALSVNSLDALNTVLQQAQGFQGGLLRKEGTERWHQEDNSTKQQYRQTINELLQELGFVLPQNLDSDMTVDHCVVFGARVERMERRIVETLYFLENNLEVSGHIFLLGSNRKLIPAEKEYLNSKLESFENSQKIYWEEVFNDLEQATEANAFVFLWRCLVPQEMQVDLESKLVAVKSTRIGSSYKGKGGHRVTTEVTVEDWMPYYKDGESQSVFAVVEQPYIRLADQLRFTVLSNGKKANADELLERIKNATFYFAAPKPSSDPLISVILDEIGRNVYRAVESLKYLENLEKCLY